MLRCALHDRQLVFDNSQTASLLKKATRIVRVAFFSYLAINNSTISYYQILARSFWARTILASSLQPKAS